MRLVIVFMFLSFVGSSQIYKIGNKTELIRLPTSDVIQVQISKDYGNISGKIYYEIFINDGWTKIDSIDLVNLSVQNYVLRNQYYDPRLRIESKGNFSATLIIRSK